MGYKLYICDCAAFHTNTTIRTSADDTAATGLIAGTNEKTKEMILDTRKGERQHPPI